MAAREGEEREGVKPDPTRITFRRGEKRSKQSADNVPVPVPVKSRSKVKLSRCVSMWKNPISQVVSLETRMAYDRTKDVAQDVNVQQFVNLKSALDEAEQMCIQNSTDGIGEDKQAEAEEVFE